MFRLFDAKIAIQRGWNVARVSGSVYQVSIFITSSYSHSSPLLYWYWYIVCEPVKEEWVLWYKQVYQSGNGLCCEGIWTFLFIAYILQVMDFDTPVYSYAKIAIQCLWDGFNQQAPLVSWLKIVMRNVCSQDIFVAFKFCWHFCESHYLGS